MSATLIHGSNGTNGIHRPLDGRFLAATKTWSPPPVKDKKTRRTCDTLVISDLHLGSEVCRAEEILKVLKSWSFRRLIILGDAFDDLRFKRLKRSHFKVLSRINKLSSPKRRIEVVWVEGK